MVGRGVWLFLCMTVFIPTACLSQYVKESENVSKNVNPMKGKPFIERIVPGYHVPN